ncbi:MAG TPA: SGNH/GDSL hydrolase family protein [Xanthobacteraceae bacterium]|jgi:acyl-CoA thioesterase I
MTPLGQLTRLAAGLIACALAPALASAQGQPLACGAPKELTRLTQPLPRTAERLAKHLPLTIVAIGSSSTYGAGASSRAASYPSQLQVDLQARFPGSRITVINRGVNGEEAREMLARFGDGVVKQNPDLVIWQVGTNSVLRDRDITPTAPLILQGVAQLKALGIDVVMIDPQYTPKVLAKGDVQQMVDLISAAAKKSNVDLFQRFAVMRYWFEHEHMAFSDFSSPDQLHMNDWSYACLAKLIGGSIAAAAQLNVASAQVHTVAHAVMP